MKKYFITCLAILSSWTGAIKAQNVVNPPTKALASTTQSLGHASHFAGEKRTCHTMEMDALLRSRNPKLPSLEQNTEEINEMVRQFSLLRAQGRTQAEVITIPVIVHVIHNGQAVGVSPNISAAQVNSQIRVLNEDFRRKPGTNGFNNNAVGADIEIEFAMALVDPQGNILAEPGIDRRNMNRQYWDDDDLIESSLKPNTIWDPTKYLNMWTVDFGPVSETLGYAQFPVASGLPGLNFPEEPANTDGVIMRYTAFGSGVGDLDPTYNLGRTTTHEVGHWLGLRHIWGDGGCGVDDFCADTPVAGEPNYDCDQNANSCTTANDLKDMIENYMDYTPDACMNVFTNDQKTRMLAVMANSPRRKELKNSTVHLSGPKADFSVISKFYCANQGITLTDASTNSPTSWSWKFFDENNALITTASVQNPTVSINTVGNISVELTATGASGAKTTKKENLFIILTGSTLSKPTWSDDLEGANPLSNWYIHNPDADIASWEFNANASANGAGSKSILFDNFANDVTGKRDWLISPVLNLANVSTASFGFSHAYAQYNNVADTLSIYYTSNCGVSWSLLWKKSGADLATAAKHTSAFVPEANEWGSNTLDLSALVGSSIHLAFVNGSNYGNNLYLDNFSFQTSGSGTGATPPVANFSANNTTGCPSSTINFTDLSTNSPTSWSWLFPGGTPSSSSSQNPIINFTGSGTYSVSLTVGNSGGQDTKTVNGFITINANPALTLSSSHPEGVCEGEEIVLSATTSNGNNVVWKDSSGSEIHQGSQYGYVPEAEETFTVQATSGNNCVTIKNITQSVLETPSAPDITFNEDNASLEVDFSGSVQWYYEGEEIPNATNSIYFPDMDGHFMVEVTNANGCSAFSEELFVEVLFLGRNGLNKQGLIVYPNPAQSHIQITGLDQSKQYSVKLIDSKGAEILTKTYQNDLIDLSALVPGLYTIVIQHDTEIFRTKLIKQ